MSGAARRSATEDGEVAPPRHFLDLRDFDTTTLRQML